MIEVELKAHIEDAEAVERRIASFAKFLRRVDKHDSYWHGSGWKADRGARGFRLRSEGTAYIVTFKTKRVENGIEVNHEREFGISDPDTFREFVLRVGCEPYYTKRKTGVAYEYNGMTLEVLKVEGLGSFLEIERLLPTDTPNAVAATRKELLSVLDLAGIPESALERRTYSEMILAGR